MVTSQHDWWALRRLEGFWHTPEIFPHDAPFSCDFCRPLTAFIGAKSRWKWWNHSVYRLFSLIGTLNGKSTKSIGPVQKNGITIIGSFPQRLGSRHGSFSPSNNPVLWWKLIFVLDCGVSAALFKVIYYIHSCETHRPWPPKPWKYNNIRWLSSAVG